MSVVWWDVLKLACDVYFVFCFVCFCFFFQAEDGIRDVAVTGVQTCALPIFKQSLYDDVELRGSRHVIIVKKQRDLHIFPGNYVEQGSNRAVGLSIQ